MVVIEQHDIACDATGSAVLVTLLPGRKKTKGSLTELAITEVWNVRDTKADVEIQEGNLRLSS